MADSELNLAKLELVNGARAGLGLALASATTTIGRAPGNTHVLEDVAISRQHARIFVRDGRHWLADLNSSHGTFVNGAKVTLQTLTHGDEIKVGATVMRYVCPAVKPPLVAPAPPTGPTSTTSGSSAKASASSIAGADARTGSFELEFGEADAPPIARPAAPSTSSSAVPGVPPTVSHGSPDLSRIPSAPLPLRGPLPPVATNYRRAVTPEGEDPFADDAAKDDGDSAAASGSASGAAAAFGAGVELRGETARQFQARTSGKPTSASSSSGGTATRSPATHTAPALADVRRKRGPFTFLRDELDQRGPFARGVAALFALAVAAGLFWGVLRLFEAVPKKEPKTTDEPTNSAPARPVLPERH
jgi:predicted component of type VI protein secretion system